MSSNTIDLGSPFVAGQSVTLAPTIPGRYALGAVVREVDEGQDLRFVVTQGGTTIHDETHNIFLEYENNDDSPSAEIGVEFEVTDVTQPLTCEVIVPAGSTAQPSIVVPRAPTVGQANVVGSAGEAQHCGPTSLQDTDGAVIQVIVSIYRKRLFLFRNFERVGEIFSGVPDDRRQIHDVYHTGYTVIRWNGGYLLTATWHNTSIYGIWGATLEDCTTASEVDLIPGQPSTYCFTDSIDGGPAFAIVRSPNTGFGASTGGVLLTLSLVGSTITVDQTDYLVGGGARFYPRGLTAVNHPTVGVLVTVSIQERLDTVWGSLFAMTYVVNTNRWHNPAGAVVGSTTVGTPTSSRFSTEFTMNGFASGQTGVRVVGPPPSGHRYFGPNVLAITDPATMQITAAAVFTDVADEASDSEKVPNSEDTRVVIVTGQQRYLTDAGDDAVGNLSSNSFRKTGFIRWRDNDENTGVIDFFFGNLGDDPFVDPANPTLIADDYFGFGAVDEYRRYSVNLADLVASGDLLAELSLVETVPVEDNGHRFYLSPVSDSTGLRIDSELNLAHQNVAQSGVEFTSPLDVPPSENEEEEESDGTVLTQLAELKICVETLQTSIDALSAAVGLLPTLTAILQNSTIIQLVANAATAANNGGGGTGTGGSGITVQQLNEAIEDILKFGDNVIFTNAETGGVDQVAITRGTAP